MQFEFNKWNVPIIQEPNELMKKLKELNLVGKKIVNIRCLGLCSNFIEEPPVRYVEIDEPIIFYLDNGDRLEIDYSEASSLKIGMNSLLEDMESSINKPNMDMNVFFSNCLNKKITGFEVSMSDELSDDYTGSHGIIKPENQMSYISSFRIYLDDFIYIQFKSFYDYGEVYVGSVL